MLPKKYLSQSEVIASYASVDILEGIGYVNFYPCAFKLSGSTTYGVAQSTSVVSGETVNKIVGAAGTETVTYDLTFNKPQSIKGKALLSYSLGSSGGVGGKGFTIVKLYKVSDATTQIGSTLTSNISGDIVAANTIPVLMSFDMSDQVYIFKTGDKLRIEIYLSAVGGASSVSGYGHDPSATADVTVGSEVAVILSTFTTRMTLSLPFILDL